MFTVADAQKLERELNVEQRNTAIAYQKTQIIDKLESWVLLSESKACAFELPPQDTASGLEIQMITKALVTFLQEAGFDLYDVALRSGSFMIGWGHITDEMLVEEKEGFCALSLRKKQLSHKKQQNTQILAKLIDQCNETIQERIQGGQSAGFCLFSIPALFGEVKLNKTWFQQEIKKDLEQRGFQVSQDTPLQDALQISWDSDPAPAKEQQKPEARETHDVQETKSADLLTEYTNQAIKAYVLSMRMQDLYHQKIVDLGEQKYLGIQLRQVVEQVKILKEQLHAKLKFDSPLLRGKTDIIPLIDFE